MKTRILAGAAITCAMSLVPAAQALRPAVTPAVGAVANPPDCTNLTTLKLPDVKVTEAVAVPAAATGAVRVGHCRVAGVIGKEIKFSLLLPDD